MRSGKSRHAVSELMGTLIMIGITLVAGAAVIGWVNGQAGASEQVYGQNVANNVNYLSEHLVVVNIQFPSSGCSGTAPNRYCDVMQISIYNNGALVDSLGSVTVVDKNAVTQAMVAQTTPTSPGAWCAPNPGCAVSPVLKTTSMTTGPIQQPTVFTITLPTAAAACTSLLCFSVGQFYTVQVIGAFGYSVQVQLTASG